MKPFPKLQIDEQGLKLRSVCPNYLTSLWNKVLISLKCLIVDPPPLSVHVSLTLVQVY